jgi:hypothetical protein
MPELIAVSLGSSKGNAKFIASKIGDDNLYNWLLFTAASAS